MLELREEGGQMIEIFQSIPPELNSFLIASANGIVAAGEGFNILMQEFKGRGFSAWFTRFFMQRPVILRARGEMAVLELRIALKNQILGDWEKISNAELPAHFFQMGFVPHIATRAIFESPAEYQSFDIHFEMSFLRDAGLDYATLDKFLNNVSKDKPAELSRDLHPCSSFMLDNIYTILNNSFSAAGKAKLLQNNVTNILIGALEQVGKDQIGKLPLSPADIEALHHVRRLIEQHVPEYLSNDVLVRKAQPRLNAFKLSYGFKRVFGINPYDYYQQLRFEQGKELLRRGDTIKSVSEDLEYESATTFIKEFKKRYGYTP
jgi:AraC-like DNA-binding protein